jgi:hypothetical protein
MNRDHLEITLESHYFNAPSKTLKLECQSVSEVAGKYKDDISADGTVMRSEIEPPAVLVRGIDAEKLSALTWKANRLLFKDPTTGAPRDLPVYSLETKGAGTVKFSIHD